MPNPWEKYAAATPAPTEEASGPWAKYGAAPLTAPTSTSLYDQARASYQAKHGNVEMPGSFEGHPENMAGYIETGPGEMAGGVADIAKGNIAKGGHRLMSGLGTTLAPAAPMLIAGTPAVAARAIAGGYLGGKVTSGAANLAGANPEQQEFAGDLGNLAGGFTAGSGLVRALFQSPAKALMETNAGSLLKLLKPHKAAVDYLQSLLEDTIKGKPTPATSAPQTTPTAAPAPASASGGTPKMEIYKEPIVEKPATPSKTPLLDELQRWDKIRQVHQALDQQIGQGEAEALQWMEAHNQAAAGVKPNPPAAADDLVDLLQKSIAQVKARKIVQSGQAGAQTPP